MDRTYLSAGVHANADTEIEFKRVDDTQWIKIGPVSIFVDNATMARIHTATAPRPAYFAWIDANRDPYAAVRVSA